MNDSEKKLLNEILTILKKHPDFDPPEQTPPIFLTHGDKDPVVPIDASKKLLEVLKNQSKTFSDLLIFEGGHEIPQELIFSIKHFLEECFN